MMKSIKDFYVGQSAELTHQYSEEEVNMFSVISGDHNPIHLDVEYAKKSIFGSKIVYGFLSGSLISAVLGNVLPGEGSIYISQTLSFLRPVFIDDVITAKVTVTEIIEEKKRILLDTTCINQNGKTVIEGSALMYYPY